MLLRNEIALEFLQTMNMNTDKLVLMGGACIALLYDPEREFRDIDLIARKGLSVNQVCEMISRTVDQLDGDLTVIDKRNSNNLRIKLILKGVEFEVGVNMWRNAFSASVLKSRGMNTLSPHLLKYTYEAELARDDLDERIRDKFEGDIEAIYRYLDTLNSIHDISDNYCIR